MKRVSVTIGRRIKRIEIMLEDIQRSKYWDLYGVGERGDKEYARYLKQIDEKAEKK